MKKKLLVSIIILFIFGIAIPPVFAVHTGEGYHPTPQPITDNYDPSSLKSQLFFNTPLNEISCKNSNHILVERNNGKITCVFPYTLVKQGWEPFRSEFFYSDILKDEKLIPVFSFYTQTENVNILKFDADMNALAIQLTSDKPEKFSVKVDKKILEYPSKECPGNIEYPDWDKYMVIINGEEVDYDERINNEKYRYLEIQVDSSNQPLGEYALRGATQIHVMYDIPYHSNSKIIEIIGICVV
jgi:hypothetical protein